MDYGVVLRRAREGDKVVRVARVEQEASENEGVKRISGIGAPYERWTVLYDSPTMRIREKYARSCFSDSLSSGKDVNCCRNHIRSDILGRLSNETLTLRESNDGLHYEVRLNEKDPEAMRIHAQVERGDIPGASTVFRVTKIGTDEEKRDGKWYIDDTIKKARLYEVGPVTDPAYLDTTASANMLRRSTTDEFAAFMEGLESMRETPDELSSFLQTLGITE